MRYNNGVILEQIQQTQCEKHHCAYTLIRSIAQSKSDMNSNWFSQRLDISSNKTRHITNLET